MEKYVVFGPIVIFMAFFGLLVLGFFYLVAKMVKRGLEDEWIGTVIDKTSFEKRDFDRRKKIHAYYTVVFQTTSGQLRKVSVVKEMWEQWQIGDNAEKRKGHRWPEKK